MTGDPMRQLDFRFPNPGPRAARGRGIRRGTTLVELAFASVIFVAVMGATLALFLTMLTEQRSSSTRLAMTHEISALHRELRQLAANGANIIVASGELDNDRVRFRRIGRDEANPVFAELRYIDEDGNNNTIRDNYVALFPDRTKEAFIRMVNNASRIPAPTGGFEPVFTRSPGFGSPLVAQFRVGDRSGARTARAERARNAGDVADDAITGPGYQGVVFRAVYGPRNG